MRVNINAGGRQVEIECSDTNGAVSMRQEPLRITSEEGG